VEMKYKKLVVIVCGGVCLCLLVYYYLQGAGIIRAWSGEVSIDETKHYPVSYVVDGDTFKADIDGREITVRLLGINAPETVDPRKPVECFGPEASAEAKSLLNGRTVELRFNPNRERTDRYGRYLLYAYRDDGLFLNEDLIKNGFAKEYTVGTPYSFQAEFRKAEAEAKAAGKGLWKACPAIWRAD
jgi:micrococcal nuclease